MLLLNQKRNKVMAKQGKKSVNYLDLIPSHSLDISFKIEAEKVVLEVENKGIFNKIAQKLLKKPRISYIHLDDMGSFVWPLIDGKRSVYQIGDVVRDHFGEACEPLYNRLVQYMKTLEAYGFIVLYQG